MGLSTECDNTVPTSSLNFSDVNERDIEGDENPSIYAGCVPVSEKYASEGLNSEISNIRCDVQDISFHHYQEDSNPSRQRTNGSRKEKRRTECINNAFSELRSRIPNVPMDTKLSKIKTLRLATSYIAYLTDIVKSSDPSDSRDGRDFRADLKSLRSRERKRKLPQNFIQGDQVKYTKVTENSSETCHMDKSTSSQSAEASEKDKGINVKRRKGRTGWPETVWAMELENKASINGFLSHSYPHMPKNKYTQNSFPSYAVEKDALSISQYYGVNPFLSDTKHNEVRDDTKAHKYSFLINENEQHTLNPWMTYECGNHALNVQNTPIYAIGARNEVLAIPEEVYPFSLPARTFTQRLPSIPHLLHRSVESVHTLTNNHIASNEVTSYPRPIEFHPPHAPFQNLLDVPFFDRFDHSVTGSEETTSSYNSPDLTELKTVSVASIKISTSTISGFATFTSSETSDLQCLGATPVVESSKWNE